MKASVWSCLSDIGNALLYQSDFKTWRWVKLVNLKALMFSLQKMQLWELAICSAVYCMYVPTHMFAAEKMFTPQSALTEWHCYQKGLDISSLKQINFTLHYFSSCSQFYWKSHTVPWKSSRYPPPLKPEFTCYSKRQSLLGIHKQRRLLQDFSFH